MHIVKPPVFKQKYNAYEQIYFTHPPVDLYKLKDDDSDSETPERLVVYDCFDKSPFYKKNEYLDPTKQIKPSDDPFNKTSKRSVHTIGKLQHSTTAYLRNNQRRAGGVVPSSIPEFDKYYSTLNPYYIKQSKNDSTLIFES